MTGCFFKGGSRASMQTVEKFTRTLPPQIAKYYETKGIPVHTNEARQQMRSAGRVVANTLGALRSFIKPGVSTEDVSQFCKNHIESQGAVASSLGYFGFPGAACTSVNDSLCHGIPSKNFILKDNDIISVDITCLLDGWYGDSCYTYHVGETSEEIKNFIDTARKCLRAGIDATEPGKTISDIGKAIEQTAKENNSWVSRSFCGHGIGLKMHQEPQVLHYPTPIADEILIEGMFFTIEPIIGKGPKPKREFFTLEDQWTVLTGNGCLSAQFEHCVGVTADGAEVFTLPDEHFDDILHFN